MAICYTCGNKFYGARCPLCAQKVRYNCWRCGRKVSLSRKCYRCGWFKCNCGACGCQRNCPESQEEIFRGIDK